MPKRGGDDEDDSASAPASALESQNDKVCDDPSPFGLPMCGNPAFPSSGIWAKGGSNESLWKSSSTAEGEEEEEVEEICLVGPKGKKKRMTLSQANFLETTFMEDYINKALEPGRKAAIAKELELEPRQVAVWFQNRRARWKNKQLETNYNVLKEKLSVIAKQNQQLQAEVTRLSNLLKSLEIEHGKDNCGKAFKRAKIEVENNMVPTSINPMGLEICDKELPKLTSDNEEEKSGSEFYDTPCTLASSNSNIIDPQCDELPSKMHNNMQLGLDDCLIVEQPPQFQLVGDMYSNPTALLFQQLTAFKLEGAYFPLLEEQPNISLNFEDQQEVSFLGMAISLTPRNGEEEEEEEGMSPWVNYW